VWFDIVDDNNLIQNELAAQPLFVFVSIQNSKS